MNIFFNALNTSERKALLILLLMFVQVGVFGQHVVDGSHYIGEKVLGAGINSISLPDPGSFQLSKKVKSATVKVVLSLDNADYGNIDFESVADFTIEARKADNSVITGMFSNPTTTLTITEHKPEAVFFKDFSSKANATGNFDFSSFYINLSNFQSNITDAAASTALKAEIESKIKIRVIYDIEYAFNVNSTTYAPVITPLGSDVEGSKTIEFTWANGGNEFKDYEFQLLRLYNTKGAPDDEKDVIADIDWSKALSFHTESSQTDLNITIGEGSGYYIWRVRPIGNYYEGGIANDLNWGAWSTHYPNTAGFDVNAGNTLSPSPLFFFHDPDGDNNYIYGRTFTEGSKVHESITYANGLQQVKQQQSYLPSKDKTIVTQQIYDYSGRPTLKTLPVPVDGDLSGYKDNFVKNSEGKMYNAENFDNDDVDNDKNNYQNPEQVNTLNSAFDYYSNNNPDLSIPDAEGYPFERTLFYTDGTGRVFEQSGVGKTHMIGDGTGDHGDGRTVKTYYSTASETELIRLFGDEAPDNESVLKTITVDQNNTASVTYTSKEGNVIATCLSFQEIDNTATFDELNEEPDQETGKFSVNDKVSANIRTEKGFISTKRLALLQTTPILLSYKVKCLTLEAACDNVNIDCNYQLQVIIHNQDDPAKNIVFDPIDLSDDETYPCVTIGSEEYKTVAASHFVASNFTNELPPGNYVIEKKLVPGDIEVSVEEATDRVEAQIKPITNLITGKLGAVRCEKMLQDFYVYLKDLTCYVNHHGNTSECTSSDNLTEIATSLTGFVFQPEHQITLKTLGGVPKLAVIESPCCRIEVPIKYTPPIDCPATFKQEYAPTQIVSYEDDDDQTGVTVTNEVTDGDKDNDGDGYDVNTDYFNSPEFTEFFPDFEGYAISILKECPNIGSVANAEAKLYKYMKGWHKKGDFNWMVYHMLTDRYNCENTSQPFSGNCNTGNVQIGTADKDDCGEIVPGTGIVCQDGATAGSYCECTQYKCSDLTACWINQVTLLMNVVCEGFDYEGDGEDKPPFYVSGGVDDDEESKQKQTGSGKNTHDDHFDEGMKGGKIVKWLAKRKMSRKMRDLTDPNQTEPEDYVDVKFEHHLVEEFLNCTGYKFARIITDESDACSSVVQYVENGGYSAGSIVKNAGKKYECKPWPYEGWCNGAAWAYAPGTGMHWQDAWIEIDLCSSSGPLEEDRLSSITYSAPTTVNRVPVVDPEADNKRPYQPSKDWGEQEFDSDDDGVEDKELKMKFPNIYDPVYAFKYFEYEIGTQRDLELSTCFTDPNDCIDANGNKVPCCKDANGNTTFCEEVSSYPDAANNQLGAAYTGVQENNNGVYTKLVVKDFCGIGQIRCPYTHEKWSCGQRYTFYQSLKSMRPDTYDNVSSEEVDCEYYTSTGVTWTQEESDELEELELDPLLASRADFEMKKMEYRCENNCESRREEFKQALVKLLLDKCYVIGKCLPDNTDGMIDPADIELMVDEMVRQCKSQCDITTFKCKDGSKCREAKTPVTTLGPTDENNSVIEFGVSETAGSISWTNNGTERTCQNYTGDASYCQFAKWDRAMHWDFEVDVPSICPLSQQTTEEQNNGGKKFDCTTSADMCETQSGEQNYKLGEVVDAYNVKKDTRVSPAVEIQITTQP